jgi:hypothetical protein
LVSCVARTRASRRVMVYKKILLNYTAFEVTRASREMARVITDKW